MPDQRIVAQHHATFDSIRQSDAAGHEFWLARSLARVLDYSEYRHFLPVLERAREACRNSDQPVADHFEDVLDMVEIGSGAKRQVEDVRLSRYACYLIVQNGDPSKPVIANGQTYFALQTRRQELADNAGFAQLSEADKRLAIRNELAAHNKHLAAAAKDAGVETPLDYAIFQDHGYKGLYGGLGNKEIHALKGLKKSHKILDHMGSTELAANLFRATQAEEKLRRDRVRSKTLANQTHHKVGRKAPKSIATTHSLSSFVKGICDVMRRSNCASTLQYVPELTWILFLRILDAQEVRDQEKAEAVGARFAPTLREPYRWQDWAAPAAKNESDKAAHPKTPEGKPFGWKRQEPFAAGDGKLFDFINKQLLPHLHSLDVDPRTSLPMPGATPKQRIIGRTMTAVERVRVDSETNLRDIPDKVHEISVDHIDDQHFFTLSQVYEDLLLKMGEKNSDGGQFFTPREVIRAMVHTVDPKLGLTVYDPCCGTGSFLAVAYEHIHRKMGARARSTDIDTLKHDTFLGREKENLVFPIALANLVLHGIDQPNLWHGNSLTRCATYGALFDQAPKQFDVILTNPPFGGKEGTDAQKQFAFKTSATQVLFVQDILAELAPGGTCAIVLDEGLLFRTNESAFVETKRKLVDECELWDILSLPGGVFPTAGAGVKTNLLFFTKGRKTESIWYYDLAQVKAGKKTPLTLAHFGFAPNGAVLPDAALPAILTAEWQADEANAGGPFPSYARMLAQRGKPGANSRYSWTIDFAERRTKARSQMQPLLAQAPTLKDTAIDLKQALKHLKKQKAPEAKIVAMDAQIREKEKAA